MKRLLSLALLLALPASADAGERVPISKKEGRRVTQIIVHSAAPWLDARPSVGRCSRVSREEVLCRARLTALPGSVTNCRLLVSVVSDGREFTARIRKMECGR